MLISKLNQGASLTFKGLSSWPAISFLRLNGNSFFMAMASASHDHCVYRNSIVTPKSSGLELYYFPSSFLWLLFSLFFTSSRVTGDGVGCLTVDRDKQ